VLTPGTARLIGEEEAGSESRAWAKEKVDAEKQLKALEKVVVACTVKAKRTAACSVVGPAEIVAKLAELGFTLEKKQIHMDEPFKALGEHDVHLRLHPEVSGILKIKISAETVADESAAAE